MSLDPQHEVHLVDSQGHCLGTVSIERIEGNRIFGHFSARPDFATRGAIFRQFEKAVNDQLFHEVDQLCRDIDAVGLRLASVDGSEALQLEDVQIMNESDLSCRVPNLGLTQATHAAAQAG